VADASTTLSTVEQPIKIDVRRAGPVDAVELVRLRTLMFVSMGIVADGPDWQAAAIDRFETGLAGPDLVGAAVDAPGGGLAGCGVIEFEQQIPSPANPTGRVGYLSNMSTDTPWRRCGIARAILCELLDEADRRGVRRVELHATRDGIDLYRSVGFAERTGGVQMRRDS